jgi:hypothetical protein
MDNAYAMLRDCQKFLVVETSPESKEEEREFEVRGRGKEQKGDRSHL